MINKPILSLPILILSSIFLFRGRIGADDYSVYITSLNLYNSFDFNSLVISLDFQHRPIWVILDFIIIFIFTPILKLITPNIDFLRQYLCGITMTIFFILTYIKLVNLYQEDYPEYKKSNFIPIAFFLSSPILIFFTGSHIESLICLLFVYIFSAKSNFSKIILSIILFFIKPYYLLVSIVSFFDSGKLFDRKKIFSVASLLLVVLLLKVIQTSMAIDSYTNNFRMDLENVYKNLFLILFSPSFGIIFGCSLYFLIFFEKNKKLFFYLKILSSLSVIVFIALFSWWHGQTPTSRYLLPLFFIFTKEIFNAFNFYFKKTLFKKISISSLVLFFLIINIPVLEFRNTSIYDYHNDAYTKGVGSGFNEKDTIYDYYSLSNHHILFANRVLYSIVKKADFSQGKFNISYNNFFPQTSLSRLLYLIFRPNDKYLSLTDKAISFKNIILSIYLFFLSFLIMYLYYEQRKFIKLSK